MGAETAEMGVVRIAVTMIGPGQGAAEAVPVAVVHDRPAWRRLRLSRLWSRHRPQPRRAPGGQPWAGDPAATHCGGEPLRSPGTLASAPAARGRTYLAEFPVLFS